MKIAFITDNDPVNRLAIDRIADRFPPAVMFVVQWSGGKKRRSLFQKLANAGQLPGLWTRNWVEAKRAQWLSGRVEEPTNDRAYVQKIGPKTVNGEEVSSELARQEIDLLIVCGAPILRKRIFGIPTIGTINIHFGLSSAYRGQHTIFWPLLEGQVDKVGATVHLIDEGVDTGGVLIEYCPEIAPTDHEFSLDLKIGDGVVDPVLEMIEELKKFPGHSLVGQPPADTGKQIFGRDRGFWISVRYALRRLISKKALPELPARVAKHYQIEPSQQR